MNVSLSVSGPLSRRSRSTYSRIFALYLYALQRICEQVSQDLLAGINMSQLFSQQSSPAQSSSFRNYTQQSPKPPVLPIKPATPAAPATSNTARKLPPTRWWERQTTSEIEVTGTVDDVINPSLLAAGKAEVGQKAVAVASLRELWDEERSRARTANGESQLSVPPGLELADSQDEWLPPECLLAQDMRGAVHDLARNVFRKTQSAASAAAVTTSVDQCSSQQPRSSQESQGCSSEQDQQESSAPLRVDLALSREAAPSQTSMGRVASASGSPSNSLSTPDAPHGGSDDDQGFLDMLATLRGSQSDSQRDSEENRQSSARHGNQSSSRPLSQEALSSPASFVDQADAIVATQVSCMLSWRIVQ